MQRGRCDINYGRAINNECKIAISSEFLIKIPPQKENISYTLVSLIMHDVSSLDFEHYISDVFYVNTGIWWHYYNDKTIQISDFPEVIYTR